MAKKTKTYFDEKRERNFGAKTVPVIATSIWQMLKIPKQYLWDGFDDRKNDITGFLLSLPPLLWTNKLLVFIVVILIIFAVMSSLIISNDVETVNSVLGFYKSTSDGIPDSTFSNLSIDITFWSLFFGFLFILLILVLILRYRTKVNNEDTTWTPQEELKYVTTHFGWDGLGLFVLFFSVAFVILYHYLNDEYPNVMGAVNSMLMFFILFGGIALFIVFMRGFVGKGKQSIVDYDDSPTILNILKRGLFTIPCLFIDLAEYIYKEYKITPSPTFTLLGIELTLITLYFVAPNLQKIYSDLVLHDGHDIVTERMLLDSAISLDVENKSFQKRDPENNSNKVSYNYALSSWIYIMDSRGSNSYKSIINYANKPLVEYNDKTHMLRVSCEVWDKTGGVDIDGNPIKQTVTELYSTSEIPLQKWNNVVFNFSGGTLDVFINSKLVCSTTGVLPGDYNNTEEVVRIGDENGIQGEITDVTYFSYELSLSSIKNIYTLNKDKK